MVQKSRLPIYTFISVFLAILFVGGVSVPLFLDVMQEKYYKLQAEVNSRQAIAMAQFIQKRLDVGTDNSDLLAEFQAAIRGQEVDRGYVCIIDQKTGQYLSHPMVSSLGMLVSSKNALYDEGYDNSSPVKWEEQIKLGRSGGGLLRFADSPMTEVVYFHSIPGVNWTVTSHENAGRIRDEISRIRSVLSVGFVLFGLILALPISVVARRVSRRYEKQVEDRNTRLVEEQEKSEALLLNILPSQIAARMKKQEGMIVDHFAQVSVLFCDIVNFTVLASETKPHKLVTLLNQVFSRFDEISQQYGVEKIKTIGDAYMAVSGIPLASTQHAEPIALMAIDMVQAIQDLNLGLNVRIGIHCGEVVAGVIGTRKFSYDLWGDTVNIAARLESHGEPGKIHCSDCIHALLKHRFSFDDNGEVAIKGKGLLHTYFLRP